MKRLALALALVGIFALLILLNFQSPIAINSPADTVDLEQNQKVKTRGLVLSERVYPATKIIKLDNRLEISCKDCKSYINRTISLVGVIEHYQNRTQIHALRITSSTRA